MPTPSFDETGATDWRASIARNQRRTRWVIALFIGIYTLVGLMIDVFVNMPVSYTGASYYASAPAPSITEILIELVTFQITPYATLIMLFIAAVALFITFKLHNKIMLMGTDAYEVTAKNVRDLKEKQLVNTIEELRIAAGLRYTPRIYIINAPYMNAFASGFTEKSAMVAITGGLLDALNRDELQAVMAHELSHIRHMDIKLTLTVAVLSNIMLIVIDWLFYSMLFSRRRDGDNRLLMVIMILRFVLPLITVLLTLFLSRTREYMADAGAVQLTRANKPLATALLKIHQQHQQHRSEFAQFYGGTAHEELRAAAYIYHPTQAGIKSLVDWSALFSTHPPLNARMAALGFKPKQQGKS